MRARSGRRGGRRGLLVVAVSAAALGTLAMSSPAGATGGGASLYAGAGPRPGPDVLYQPLAGAPQFGNTGVWNAAPILVSGATAYRDGEFLYQDFLYDDHGAFEAPDPADPKSAGDTFSRPDGTYTYPTAAAYANNAADLVEFRVKPGATGTAFRVTMNTMVDPTLVAFSIALGGTDGTVHPFPFGANVSSPADLFLTVHASAGSMVADLRQASSPNTVLTPAPTVTTTTAAHQFEVDVPHAEWDPTGHTERMAMGVGLWDATNGVYLLPGATASATAPGGAGTSTSPPAFFNVAFRTNSQEPMPTPTNPVQLAASPQWWRDAAQAATLATGDITPFAASVDFTKLAAAVDDESGVPQTGAFDRILASHFQTAPGNNFAVVCLAVATNGGGNCPGQYQGNLQPYAIYVPPAPPPATGYGMTLMLHSLGANYNQYLGTQNQSQFANRGTGSLTITPESRGPDGFNDDLAGADVFEVWADVAARYPINADWTAITGYSMGGMGTFKLAEQFPDLFAIAQPTVGYSASTSAAATGLVPSLRNIPFLMWNMAVDELVPASMYVPTAQALDSAGYRYELDVYAPGDHLTLAINDEYAPAAAFLGTTTVNRDPPHVTFAFDPALDYPSLGFVADHAYWLHALKERDATQTTGTIDILSHGFGVGDPTPSATQHGTGTLTGGTIPALAYVSQSKTWSAAPSAPVADQLDITATNVGTVSVNVTRANVDCNATLHVTTDGPLVVTLDGCPNGVSYWGGAVPPANVPEVPLTVILLVPALAAATVAARRRRAAPYITQ